jgi:hypothetical protein
MQIQGCRAPGHGYTDCDKAPEVMLVRHLTGWH